MKKIAYISFVMLAVASCKRDITSINVDPKNPQVVPSYTLFTNAQRVTTNILTSTNVNLNIFRLVEQYWQETTYTDESNYDIVTRQIPDELWDEFYRDVLRDFERAKELIPTDVTDAVQQKNEIAVADIMEVYVWYYLLTTFGNVPYTEALNIDNQFPSYDDQQAIYTDLLARLNTDISAIDASGEGFGSADIIYGGSMDAWSKFANSFKLKLGMLVADVDANTAKTAVESAVAAGVFESNGDNALFNYLSAPPNTNPVWVDLVQSGRADFVACSTVVSHMLPYNDPRLPYYFTIDDNGSFSGGDPGSSSNFNTFSKPSGLLRIIGLPGAETDDGSVANPDFPGDLLDYSEVEFLLAEAVERGFNVGGTAAEHYNAGITASIEYWVPGVSSSAIAEYLALPQVAYATATGDWKQKIGTQKWLALYNRGYDAWVDTRRLGYPALVAPESAQTAFPVRFVYPINEQNVNTGNYDDASSAIGGDAVTTKLFWDK